MDQLMRDIEKWLEEHANGIQMGRRRDSYTAALLRRVRERLIKHERHLADCEVNFNVKSDSA